MQNTQTELQIKKSENNVLVSIKIPKSRLEKTSLGSKFNLHSTLEIVGSSEDLEDFGIQFHNPILEAMLVVQGEFVIVELELYPSTNEDISKLTDTLLNWDEKLKTVTENNASVL